MSDRPRLPATVTAHGDRLVPQPPRDQHISRLVDHNTVMTETGYRKQVRPVIQEGAVAMNTSSLRSSGDVVTQ
jgi:hypothetical protein